MKRISFAAVLLIAALLLASCGSSLKNAISTGTHTLTTAADHDPSAAPDQTTADKPVITEPAITTEPEIPGPVIPEMTGPVKALSCLDAEGNIRNMYDAGEGRAVVECIKYYDNWSEFELYNCEITVYLIDTLTDTILSQGNITSEYEYRYIVGVMSNGEIVTFDYDDSQLSFYDENFELIRKFDFSDADGSVELFGNDEKSECLCLINDGSLYEINCETGELSPVVEFDDTGLYIDYYDRENGLVLFTANSDDEINPRETAVYSVKDGKTLYRFGDYAVSYFSNKYLIRENYEYEYDENGDYLCSHVYYYIYDKVSGKPINAIETSDLDTYLDSKCGSERAVGVSYTYYDEDYNVENISLKIADLPGGKYAEYDLGSKYFEAATCYTAFSGRHLIGVTENPDDPRSSLIVFDSSFIELDKNIKPAEFKEQPEEPVITLPDYLREVREKADAIERDFSVRVLIDDECYGTSEADDYTLISTSENDKWLGIVTDGQKADQISSALDKLREGLSFYPEGFFRKFRNYRGAGGIRILILRDIISTGDTTFTAGGIQYNHGAWYNVWIDIDELRVTDTIHHEIWHAVEELITAKDYSLFTDWDWSKLNPGGFEYQNDLDNYYQTNKLDDFLIENKKDAYFARIYSTVNAKEDRATLIEFVLMENFNSYNAKYYGYPTAYEAACSFPGTKAKLDCMASAVENIFGYVYWEK